MSSVDKELEEGEISAYMDEDHGGTVDPRVYQQYLLNRYKQVKDEYADLQCHKREAQARNDRDFLAKVTEAFHKNYTTRKWVVSELHGIGVDVGDSFVKLENGKG